MVVLMVSILYRFSHINHKKNPSHQQVNEGFFLFMKGYFQFDGCMGFRNPLPKEIFRLDQEE